MGRPVCSKCYSYLDDGIRICPKCGEYYYTVEEQQQMRREKHEKKYREYGNNIGTGIEVFLHGMIGIPVATFGVMFMTMAIIVGLLKIMSSPIYAMIGVFWGVLS